MAPGETEAGSEVKGEELPVSVYSGIPSVHLEPCEEADSFFLTLPGMKADIGYSLPDLRPAED